MNINDLTMDQIVAFMKEQSDPKLFIVRERFKFWSNMERKPGETLQELAARIRQDAATCDFPSIQDPQDEALRQRFICSVNNEAVLKALFKVKDTELDFAKAVKIAIETEDAAKVAKETVYGSKPRPVNKVKTNNKGGRTKNHQQSNSMTSDSANCYSRQAEGSALSTMQRQLSTAINTLCTELRLVRTELSDVKAECAALKQAQLQTHAEIQDCELRRSSKPSSSWGKRCGLEGEKLLQFAEKKEKERREREERARKRELQKAEIERQKVEREAALEKERQEREAALERERQTYELRKAEMEAAEAEKQRLHELEKMELELRMRGTTESNATNNNDQVARAQKLPAFNEHSDKMDAYLERFERFAASNNWGQETWAVKLSALLTGKALDFYARLPREDAEDYNKLKGELLKHYDHRRRIQKTDINKTKIDSTVDKYDSDGKLKGFLL
nr:hypothetical protein BaRGS_035248 [Batillaria attramentaria]